MPQQRDDSSCGIYVCLFVQSLLRGTRVADDITAEDIAQTRKAILQQLVTAEMCELPYYVTLEKGAPINPAGPGG